MMANKSGWKINKANIKEEITIKRDYPCYSGGFECSCNCMSVFRTGGDTEGIGFRLQSISRDDLFRR